MVVNHCFQISNELALAAAEAATGPSAAKTPQLCVNRGAARGNRKDAKRCFPDGLTLEGETGTSVQAALRSTQGSITILVTRSSLSRHTLYISGASSSEMRCEMI